MTETINYINKFRKHNKTVKLIKCFLKKNCKNNYDKRNKQALIFYFLKYADKNYLNWIKKKKQTKRNKKNVI